jgi:hypothetical protein
MNNEGNCPASAPEGELVAHNIRVESERLRGVRNPALRMALAFRQDDRPLSTAQRYMILYRALDNLDPSITIIDADMFCFSATSWKKKETDIHKVWKKESIAFFQARGRGDKADPPLYSQKNGDNLSEDWLTSIGCKLKVEPLFAYGIVQHGGATGKGGVEGSGQVLALEDCHLTPAQFGNVTAAAGAGGGKTDDLVGLSK